MSVNITEDGFSSHIDSDSALAAENSRNNIDTALLGSRLLNVLLLYLYCLFAAAILHCDWRNNHEGSNDSSTNIGDVERGEIIAIPDEANNNTHQFQSVLCTNGAVLWEKAVLVLWIALLIIQKNNSWMLL